ncbi:methyl-accepting chemotaxis protein [Salsuginibacillus halophilus]|uniref:Methyl-accepting chemotaxis protein n=1 Tax=Salsuginibacillus halophilus TaxID=517424 RepID=A0A2P8HY94_9BACI|nr:methyl-accepting chemotaxis protein [Salsuginibacillus halophilus]PSL51124.1 methyl-accepting chemotaxis protein [Salsuginibacillus halophilus]
MRQSMKAKFVAAAAIMLVGTMLITSLVIYYQLADGIEATVEENASAVTEDTERYIQEFMDKYALTVHTLSEDPRAENFTADTDRDDAWEGIRSTHEAYLDRESGIQLMYIGEADGAITSTPEIDVPEDFDATERPWYTAAEANPGETVWTSPYIDIETDELIITAARTIETGGVKAIDISLDAMVSALETADTGYEGELALIDEEGVYIAHTNEAQIGDEVADSSYLANAVSADEQGSVEGEGQTAYYQTVDGFGWTILANYDDDILYQDLATVRYTFIIVSIIAVLIGIAGAYAAAGRFTRPVREMRNHVQQLADGDLNREVHVQSRDEIGELGTALQTMTNELRGLIGSIQHSADDTRTMAEDLSAVSEETAATSDDMSNAVNDVAQGASRQAGEIENVNEKVKELSTSVDEAEQQTEKMTGLSSEMRQANDQGSERLQTLEANTTEAAEVFSHVHTAVEQLSEKVEAVTNVVDTISAFADQTNLLALNASIEAARAGEHGKGFAVVAEEVRKLAEQSIQATEQIHNTLQEVTTETKQVEASMQQAAGVQHVQQQSVQDTHTALQSIITSVDQLSSAITGLGEDLHQVKQHKDDITTSMTTIAEVSEHAAATAEEVSASADEQAKSVASVGESSEKLNDLSAQLQQKTKHFKL